MNNGKKPNAPRRLPIDGLLCGPSRIVIDPKCELAAVVKGKTNSRGSVATLNPFLVLPPEQLEASNKWFRLIASTALNDVIKARKKEGHAERKERNRQQRAH